MAALDLGPPLTNGNGHLNGGTNGVHLDGPNSLDVASASASGSGSGSAFDSSVVRTYLSGLLPALLGANMEDLWSLFEDEFEERVQRFAGEGSGVMYVTKIKHDLGGGCTFLVCPTHICRLAD
jgi:hypothetical protein